MRRGPGLAALLLVTGTGALSTDTYIAALPELQRSLGTSTAVAQLTMTAFIIGSAVGQLVSGPISDARGRRRIVIGACVCFVVLSAACAVATSGWLLVAERVLQGLAVGTGMSVGRAMVNDVYAGLAASQLFGTLVAVSLIGPVVAPALGSVLVGLGDWRLVFWFLGLVGVAMTVGAVLDLPETLPPERRHPGGVVHLLRRTRELLTDRHFAAPLAQQCLTVGGFFIYIGGSSFVLQEQLGVTPATYTAVFASNALAMVTASVLFRVLVARVGPVRLRTWAVWVQTVAVVLLAGVTLTAPGQRPALGPVWVCLAGMTAGLGMYLPAVSSIGQHAGRRYAGTASALGGGLPFLVGALTTPMTGLLGSQTVLTMAVTMVVFFLAAAVVSYATRSATLDPLAVPTRGPAG